MMQNNEFVTVSQLNNRIKLLLDCDPMLSSVKVLGELSNYKVYPSGHHYFTLKDAESSLKCVMFRGDASKLRFKPENGLSVLACGRISLYSRDGAYQLYVTNLIPQGNGDLQLAFEQLKKKLGDEGLFDEKYKKPLPKFPQRIAIVTSSAGAAVHDVIRILNRRWPLSEVVVVPVKVQGAEAPEEIAHAIEYTNNHQLADLIITGRGGGSIEDLWAFNTEVVARAIFNSRIPIISAVGHEPDVTISDYVSDRRAATPSHAAEMAVPDIDEIKNSLNSFASINNQSVLRIINSLKDRVNRLSSSSLLKSPDAYINFKRLELDNLSDRLISALKSSISKKRNEFIGLTTGLEAMSPLKVISRGFIIAENINRDTITSVKMLAVDESISLTFFDGEASCRVESKKEKS